MRSLATVQELHPPGAQNAGCPRPERALTLAGMSLLLLFNQGQVYEQLLQAALKHHEEGRHRETVVFAQMAAEVAAESKLNVLIQQVEPEALRPLLQAQLDWNANLARKEIRRLYDALTGESLAQQAWWSAYKTNSERRNDVAHRAAAVSAAEAAEGLSAVESLVRHLWPPQAAAG